LFRPRPHRSAAAVLFGKNPYLYMEASLHREGNGRMNTIVILFIILILIIIVIQNDKKGDGK
jgi:hypothetical protein